MLGNQEINLSEHHEAQLPEVLNMRIAQHLPTLTNTSLSVKFGIQTHADGILFH